MTQDPGTVHTIEFFTYDDNGDLAAADATPVVTVHAPDGTDTLPTVTTPSTGRYLAEYTIGTDLPGRYWWEATAEVATEPVYSSGRFTVRDPEADELGTAYPYGLASWVSAV